MRAPARARLRGVAATALPWASSLALLAFAGAIVLSVFALQVAHVGDNYQIDIDPGIFLSLSKSAASGLLYPPLYDGRFYGGTRYMPIPVLLPAGLTHVVGNLIVAEKLLVYLFAFLLFGLVFVILRRRGCPALVAVALIAAVLASRTGVVAVQGVHWDAAAVFFQLAAVAVIDRSTSTRAVALAGVLCGLAAMTKLNAAWAAAAIFVWLLVQARNRLWVFLATLVVSLGAMFGAVELGSHGRFSDNLSALGFAAFQGRGSATEGASGFGNGLDRLVLDVPSAARTALFLLPFAFLALAYAAARRKFTIFHVALVTGTAVLFGTYYDRGAGPNHLIDFAVLTAVAVGILWGQIQAPAGRITWLAVPAALAALARVGLDPKSDRDLLIALVLLAVVGAAALALGRRWPAVGFASVGAVITLVLVFEATSFYRSQMFAETKVGLKTLVGRGDNRYATHPFTGAIGARDEILSEDAYVDFSRGRRPVVLDEWALGRLFRLHPAWSVALANRVRAREFDEIVLAYPLEVLYTDGHFGIAINRQIARNYRLARTVRTAANGTYWIYARRGARA